jgi:hypothetical protein
VTAEKQTSSLSPQKNDSPPTANKWRCDYCPAVFNRYEEAVKHETECKTNKVELPPKNVTKAGCVIETNKNNGNLCDPVAAGESKSPLPSRRDKRERRTNGEEPTGIPPLPLYVSPPQQEPPPSSTQERKSLEELISSSRSLKIDHRSILSSMSVVSSHTGATGATAAQLQELIEQMQDEVAKLRSSKFSAESRASELETDLLQKENKIFKLSMENERLKDEVDRDKRLEELVRENEAMRKKLGAVTKKDSSSSNSTSKDKERSDDGTTNSSKVVRKESQHESSSSSVHSRRSSKSSKSNSTRTSIAKSPTSAKQKRH